MRSSPSSSCQNKLSFKGDDTCTSRVYYGPFLNDNLYKLHPFTTDISLIEKPQKFTFPFYYEPHALSIVATKELQKYLTEQDDFVHNFGLSERQEGLVIGKMFGVLVVETPSGEIGYLAACSGKLAGTNRHHYFVPPIFDMLDEEGFFLKEESTINQLNRKIEKLETGEELKYAVADLEKTNEGAVVKLTNMRVLHKQNKAERKQIRTHQKSLLAETKYQEVEADLIKQSYRDQHEYDILKAQCKLDMEQAKLVVDQLQGQIANLKEIRKQKSAALQRKLFDQYQFLNAYKEAKNVLGIFEEANNIMPPAGAGECAAPKLLQYAYQNALKPVCMAEFWWGASPSSEVRKHKSFYPACRGKCEPILGHMLQGLAVDDNPMLQNPAMGKELEIIFEDEHLIVINKPTEFLSVPGIHIQDSVQQRILARYPKITGPLIIHRLDMSTSGILVLAKHKHAHQFIQDQFIRHTVRKRYTALLDGLITQTAGIIDLPLRVDLDDRPRQVVCYEYGKAAQTQFEVVGIENGKTRIHYFPLTGRTHQLRVHSAHQLGLNTPIVGDDLYGTRADRLHLHAGFISFVHPVSRKVIEFEIADPF
ncbi:RluA family pseudouridine synthase [Sphingobacterium lumbrici]|uniref:RluA family pseudouridine synthase n=1 Tax=Sphingobacterium lumbrici TaxID=2559600 RepID=UPI001127B0AF|nr:RluA family pseudouridine synthase [Sphingobacterium lumbrici]